MFKGYLEMKGKKVLEKYKDRTEFYSYEHARKNFDEYGGVLKNEFIQIDIDNSKDAEILFKVITENNIRCNVLKTDRGRHFYFKNTNVRTRKQGDYNALGIKMDIGLGSKNTVVPLKINGKTRRLIKVDTIQKLPKWLYPLGKKQLIDFSTLSEGDGRNQTLFNYILKLQSQGFTKDEIKETIKIINNYILKEPLSTREIETILRDEAFVKQSFYIDKKLQHEKFAKYICSEKHVIKINNTLHIYKDGIYTNDKTDVERATIEYIPTLTQAKRRETLSYIELIAERKYLSKPNKILVKNGLLDIETLELTPFTYEYIAQNIIPIAYNPAACNETLDKTLDKIACNDKELRLLIEEMVGYMLFRRNELGKCFILIGYGSNGKSTLLNVIKTLLGSDNYSSVGLEELKHRFKPAELFGKLANIGDDISNSYIEDDAVFKKLTTGETINVERKGKDPFDFNNYAKLIFSCNDMPRINDTSNGLKRRLVLIPFNARFSSDDEDFDPFIYDKLISNESLEYLLNLAIQGLKRVLNNRSFTIVEAVEKELKEYEKLNNPIIGFIEDKKIENETTKDVYLKYSTYCVENGLKALSRIQFSRKICDHGFKTKQLRMGKTRKQIFVSDV